MPAEPARPNGFTLVEVLVALVATSMLLAIVMNGALMAKERGNRAAERREAALLARHLITRATAAPFAQGMRRGSEGDLSWEVIESVSAADPRGRFLLADLSVAVKDDGGRLLFSGTTRRIKEAAQQ
jgi:prepilin-type N-terminal cleavage/methylation domain-containing protein